MHNFSLYFNIGREHILDVRNLDHILFVTALCIRYLFTDWKKLLILITAFTVGHSITLALSVFDIVRLSNHWVDFLIPVAIIIAAISNVFVKKFTYKTKYPPIYFFALFFGLIHGLVFSNFFYQFLGRGNMAVQMLAFNVGLAMGQLLIVVAILLLSFLCLHILKVNRREYILFLSGGVLAIALQMALQRIPF